MCVCVCVIVKLVVVVGGDAICWVDAGWNGCNECKFPMHVLYGAID